MNNGPSDRPVGLVIPFYRRPDLVPPLFRSLEGIAAELRALPCSVLAVNDSPEDTELRAVLDRAVNHLNQSIPCRLVQNERNLGFVRSANLGLRAAVAAGHDAILLNSDTEVFAGAMAEIRRVAYLDPMTGFVSPRSNNATICSLPHQPEFRKLLPQEAYAVFRQLSGYLPESHYLPTGVGFCLYIKHEILAEFGLLDESYEPGYNEENDLIMRANRCGYRAAAANRAFVYHIGESSFQVSSSLKETLEEKNAKLLLRRYPEYASSVAKYLDSPHYEAERMLAAMLPDSQGRLDMVFDFTSVGPYHNGTFTAAKEILRQAVEAWHPYFHIHVMVSDEALRFHKLDEIKRLFFVPPDAPRVFAIAFRFGQPFEYRQLSRMSRMGVINVYTMLDSIAWDCLYLNQVDLPVIWGAVFTQADGVLYISEFTGEQFRRRFRTRPGLREMVAYLSLDLRDYAAPEHRTAEDGAYILVIGNAFAHKYMRPTVDALNEVFPCEKVVALGFEAENHRQNVVAYGSGNLSEARMRNLVRGAKFVVYPSHYEGFGIPVLESLAYGKPVLARAIPVMEEIRERIQAHDNLILYQSTDELIARLRRGFPVWKPNPAHPNGAESGSWAAVTRCIGEFLRGLAADFSFADRLVPRLEQMRLLRDQVDRPAPSVDGLLPAGEAGTEVVNNAVLTRQLDAAAQALRDRDARIDDIYHSYSWRITAPMRKAADLYLRFVRR